MKYRICLFISMLTSCLAWLVRINPYADNTFYFNTLMEFIYCCSWTSSALFFFFALKKTFEAAQITKELDLLKKQRDLRVQNDAALSSLRKKAAFSQENALKQLEYLQRCLDRGEYAEAEKYIRDISKQFDESRFRPVCGDSLISSILQGKKEYAEGHGIRVEYSIPFFRNPAGGIRADLSGLFFNLLDNGIEGCLQSAEPLPFLFLQVKFHAGFLHIMMKNSKNPDICFTHRTTKEDTSNHGFGLSIMEEIVNKYDGSFEWLDKSDIFESRLMLRYR